MAELRSKSQDGSSAALPYRRWLVAVLGLALLASSHPLVWQIGRTQTLFAPLGLGLAFTAWLGFRIIPPIAVVLAIEQIALRPAGTTTWQAAVDAVLSSAEIACGWWCYRQAGGTRRLDDPRSAILFLLLVPGLFAGAFAGLQALNGFDLFATGEFTTLAVSLWISNILGIVAVAPPLLAVATPWLVYYRLALADPTEPRFVVHPRLTWTTGDILETVGLRSGRALWARCWLSCTSANRGRIGIGGACS